MKLHRNIDFVTQTYTTSLTLRDIPSYDCPHKTKVASKDLKV